MMRPANTLGEGGTTVVYGSPSAQRVLHVYADPRCPYCKRMDVALGDTMRRLADDGHLTLYHHFAAFLDDALGGSGSHRALNALGAAADVGQVPFLAYLRTLFAHQPPEDFDGFASPETLLMLAGEVEGLRSAEFDEAVLQLRYREWADRVAAAFEASGVTATPTVLLDGAPVTVLGSTGHAVAQEEFLWQLGLGR
ncbi:DsbA family protein [Streptomyces sp. NPDC054796]